VLQGHFSQSFFCDKVTTQLKLESRHELLLLFSDSSSDIGAGATTSLASGIFEVRYLFFVYQNL
jgi:hypothetical protein